MIISHWRRSRSARPGPESGSNTAVVDPLPDPPRTLLLPTNPAPVRLAEGSTRAEAGEDLSGQGFLDFVVSGHSFLHTGGGIDPDGM